MCPSNLPRQMMYFPHTEVVFPWHSIKYLLAYLFSNAGQYEDWHFISASQLYHTCLGEGQESSRCTISIYKINFQQTLGILIDELQVVEWDSAWPMTDLRLDPSC